MISNARGSHSSPGIYTKEIDLSYAAKSLGITTLGVVGETLKGPAFEPIKIENWREFQTYFGGTSAEKFSGSKYPKYELPYIAKSYLQNSNQLEVCRVLGLSGYNAGPAWLITASDINEDGTVDGNKYVVAVLRSRGSYSEYGSGEYDPCKDTGYEYDKLTYTTKNVTLTGYTSASTMISCGNPTSPDSPETRTEINSGNLGRFTILVNSVKTSGSTTYEYRYPVSLNPSDKDYILNVLGTSAQDGEAPLFVEELFDIALIDKVTNRKIKCINWQVEKITSGLESENSFEPIVPSLDKVLDFCDVVSGSTGIPKHELSFKNLGQRFVDNVTVAEEDTTIVYYDWDETKGEFEESTEAKDDVGYKEMEGVGLPTPGSEEDKHLKKTTTIKAGFVIYVVDTKIENGKKEYYYKATEDRITENERIFIISKDNFYQVKDGDNGLSLEACTSDINDYKERFRCASTPWVVSEFKGDGASVMVRKLFRFHTISDGNTSNSEVKISIQNIRPNEGLFDVIVRAFDDTDANPIIVERFTKCSMVPGTNNFIGLKIGTFDGEYELKSKYITVEVIVNDMTESCIPAGFLGYPMRDYGAGINNFDMCYNIDVDDDIKAKKQYFGFSNIRGIDVDLFKYKGRTAYNNVDSLSNGFHLDSRFVAMDKDAVTVDGEMGFRFTSVSEQNTTGINGGAIPVMGLEHEMAGTIYEDINLRKFTVCFYGGFDGWDIYRTSRTNTDKFKANKYKGIIKNGNGLVFNQIFDMDSLNLSGKCITSDYYAYLAGIRQFMNPEAVDINVFATPGIDYVNNTLLSSEALTMIEEDRGDALYIMTTPDKAFGNSDNDMLYPDEVVSNLYDSEIDSSYAATYYPWVKYFDNDNKVYINLPATKDVVKSLAFTDNTSYPWFAPAGIIRGNVECERAHFITKLEDEDTLYSGMINPIKTFAVDGVKIWGQKTMYSEDTPLNRINVRRLMLRVKKLITGACRRLIFEQNDATVKAQFEGLVKPILDDIKAKRGIYDYRLEVNDSAEARDRMELPAVIYIKPTKALEYIDLTFVIMPESAKFDE